MTPFIGGALVAIGAVVVGALLSAIPVLAARRRARLEALDAHSVAVAELAAGLSMDVQTLRHFGMVGPKEMLDYISPRLTTATGLFMSFDGLGDRASAKAATAFGRTANAVVPAMLQSPDDLANALAALGDAAAEVRGAVVAARLRWHPIRRWLRTRRKQRRAAELEEKAEKAEKAEPGASQTP